MFNLLPLKDKKLLKREYRLRLTVTFLAFSLSTAVVAAVLLLPSYVRSVIKERSIEDRRESVKRSIAAADNLNLNLILKQTKQKVDVLRPIERKSFSEFIAKILPLRGNNIRLSAVTVSRGKEGGESGRVILSLNGLASTRDDLTAYKRRLDLSEDIASVAIPLSSFIRDRNNEFTARIVSK